MSVSTATYKLIEAQHEYIAQLELTKAAQASQIAALKKMVDAQQEQRQLLKNRVDLLERMVKTQSAMLAVYGEPPL